MSKYEIGTSASRTFSVTRESVELFVRMSGDANPIHVDEEFAKTTRFGRCIAPGMQIASYISSVLANDLPGPGTIYMEQLLKFRQPVFVGEKVIVRLEITDFPKDGQAILATTCLNEAELVVVEGTARVKLP